MTDFWFDPASPGARRLARQWVPCLERWEVRVPDGHFFVEGDGEVVKGGGTMEVGAPAGEQLVQHGYELVSVRRVRPGD